MAKQVSSANAHVVDATVDTPKGSRNKYKYDERRNAYFLKKTLPLGAVFPFDFGYIPGTRTGDGDPIDILMLMEEPAFTGCIVRCRIIGIIKAEQTEQGKTVRNDRLLGVALASAIFGHITSIDEIEHTMLNQVEHFFTSYNIAEGKKFAVIGRGSATEAMQLLAASYEL